MSDFSFSDVYDLPTNRTSATFTSKTSEVFKEQHDIAPIVIKDSAGISQFTLHYNTYLRQLKSLLKQHSNIDVAAMGVPKN